MGENNGFAEHKIHINAELARIGEEVNSLDTRLTAHEIQDAAYHSEILSEIKSVKGTVKLWLSFAVAILVAVITAVL